MSCMVNTVFAVLIALSVTVLTSNADPCDPDNHRVLSDPRRSSAVSSNESVLCDGNLQRETWYRFSSVAGDKVATDCPDVENACSTEYPIWTDGVFPGTDETKILDFHMKMGGDCKAETFPVEVKNCSNNFYVYKLEPSTMCDSAYCAGDRFPCPDGESAEDGYSPCYGNFPNDMHSPYINVIHRVIQGDHGPEDFLELVCHFNHTAPGTSVQVQWFQNTRDLTGIEYAEAGKNLSTLPLDHSSDWIFQEYVTCRVRTVFSSGSGVPGPWFPSEKFLPGFVVSTETSERFIEVELLDGASEVDVYVNVTLTIPPLCYRYPEYPCVIPFQFTYEQYNYQCMPDSDCNAVFEREDWLNSPSHRHSSIKVTARIPSGNVALYNITLHTASFNPGRNAKFDHISAPVALSVRKQRPNNIRLEGCRIYSDPHLDAFGVNHIEMGHDGEFVMLKHVTSGDPDGDELVLVTSIFKEGCIVDDTRSCMCGVAVRFGKHVLVLNRCNNPPGVEGAALKMRYYDNGCDDLPLGLEMIKVGGRYEIHLPTGGLLTVEVRYYRDYHVDAYYYPSQEGSLPTNDDGNTFGLCGRLGKRGKSALILRDASKSNNDEEFVNEWRAERGTEEIFFGQNGQEHSCDFSIKPTKCECTCDGPNSTRYLKCGFDFDLKTSTSMELTHMFHKNAGNDKQNVLNALKRENDYLLSKGIDPETTFDIDNTKRIRPASKTQCTHKSYDADSALKVCWEELEKAGFTDVCQNVLTESGTDAAMRACAVDLQSSGDRKWVGSAVEGLRYHCRTLLTRSTDHPLTAAVVNKLCPFNCHDNGRCNKHGECNCKRGYAGDDCGVQLATPPFIDLLNHDGLCDRKYHDCRFVQLFGENFAGEPHMTCHFEQLMNEGTIFHQQTSAYLFTTTEARCVLPKSAANVDTDALEYSVRMSNDGGKHSSQPFTFVSYHSDVHQCAFHLDSVVGDEKVICKRL